MARLAAILTLGMACATFLGSALSVLSPFIVADLGISRTELGWLFTAIGGTGALGSLVAGPVTDRLGGRRMLDALFLLVVLGVVGAAIAPSFGWLLAAALVAGLPNAAGNPATNKLIAEHVPPGRRGVIIGAKQSGVALSIFLAGAVLPPVAVAAGWRPTLALTAVVPVVGLAFARAIPARAAAGPPGASGRWRPSGGADDTSTVSAPADADRLGTQPSPGSRVRVRHPIAIRWLAMYGALMGAGGAVVFGYLPLFAYEEVGMSEPAAGAAAAALGLVAVAARLVWGWRLEHFTDFPVPLGALAAVSVVATLAIWASPAVGPWLLWTGALLAGASVAAWNAVGMLAVVVLTDAANAGRASGVVLFGFLGGFTTSPVLFGLAVDRTGSYDLGWSATVAILAAATVVTVVWRVSVPPGSRDAEAR